jgi:peroxidase
MKLSPDISQEKWNTLRSLYLRVADIDLFTGGLAEFPVPGGTVGVTFACIIREQFQRFVVGDRYFFTHTNNVGTQLNQNQIGAIRNVRMSDIICLTSNIQHIQSWAFLIPSPPNGPNPLVSCSNAFSLNIDAFFCK